MALRTSLRLPRDLVADAELEFRKLKGALRKGGIRIAGRQGDAALEQVARDVARFAKGNLSGAPGTYPRGRTDIVAARGGVELRAPWAFAAEFGANTRGAAWGGGRGRWSSHWGFPTGRYPGLAALWAPRVSVGTDTGYIVGKAWRDHRRALTADVADNGLDQFSAEFRRAGFPKG